MAAPRNLSDLPRGRLNSILIARAGLAADAWRAGRNLNPLRRPAAPIAPSAPNRGSNPARAVGAGARQPEPAITRGPAG